MHQLPLNHLKLLVNIIIYYTCSAYYFLYLIAKMGNDPQKQMPKVNKTQL